VKSRQNSIERFIKRLFSLGDTYETKFTAMEEKEADALEVAAQEAEESEAQAKNPSHVGFRFFSCIFTLFFSGL